MCGCDVRGAWGADDHELQQSKIVEAISGTGAEVVGLTEIENSARITGEADAATADLVAALNEHDGEGTWAYVPTGEAYIEQGLDGRSEEHTSELQSRGHLVCRLLLEKKKNQVSSPLICVT